VGHLLLRGGFSLLSGGALAYSDAWFDLQDQREKRNTLKVLASGHGSISDQSKWPPELFSPTSLCYGLTSVDCYDENAAPTNVLSFCWKGRNLPIYLRTKYAEFNYVIRVSREGVLLVCGLKELTFVSCAVCAETLGRGGARGAAHPGRAHVRTA
jgi:hypothetical protein